MNAKKKTYSTSGIILFLLSLVYLGAELVFNRQLLDVSSSVQSDPDEVERIQYFGRAASGLGFTLLVQGIFQQFGFRIIKRKQWTFLVVTALICMAPFVLTLGQTVYEKMAGAAATGDVPYTHGMYWGLLPFAGFFFVLAGRRYKAAVILGLFLMTWPAMFYGQRLAVERFLISPTTAEDRLNAHYILLLRSGIESCTVLLDGAAFCDGPAAGDAAGDVVEKRSTRAVMGALFMLNTGAVFDGLSISRDQLINSIAQRDMWFSSKEYYQQYLQKVADKRDQYEKYLNDTYYLPYRQASDLYLKTYNKAASLYTQSSASGKLEKMADDADRQVADQVEQGWEKYEHAVNTYGRLSVVAAMASSAASGAENRVYTKFCRDHESACNRALGAGSGGINMDSVISAAKTTATDQFYQQTGYPPDLATKDDFTRHQKTQEEIRVQVEKKLREQIDGYELPPEWYYDPVTFRNDILRLLQGEAHGKALEIASRAQQEWRNKVQSRFNVKVDPGLSPEEFFRKLGGNPLPPLKDLVMSEDAFRTKYIVPLNRKIADETIDAMKKEGPSFANQQEQAEKGKDYIRVLYVPPIALCLSIMIVVVTIGRYMTSAATDATKKIRWVRGFSYRGLKMIRPVYWVVYLALAVGLPYKWPNAYISTKAYQKYYHFARDQSPVTSQVLDWVVHVQPIIYRAGAVMPDVGYMKKAQGGNG